MTSGTFVRCDCDSEELTLSGNGGSETTASVQGATVTLDGKKADLSDLKPGDKVKLSGSPVTAVEATR
jgi:hypothetical protein